MTSGVRLFTGFLAAFALATYLATSFVCWGLNPGAWPDEARAVTVFVIVLAGIPFAIAFATVPPVRP